MERMDPKDLSAWKDQTPGDAGDETVRARSEEARLTEEAKRKDAQINALADALEKYSVRILVIGEGNQLPAEVAKLLRELGRLP